jgi:hypothetical protein
VRVSLPPEATGAKTTSPVSRAAASVCTRCWSRIPPSGAAAASPGPCTSSHHRTGEAALTLSPEAAHTRKGRMGPALPNHGQ